MPKEKKKSFYLDYSILLPYLFLNVIGLIMVYSSTSYNLIRAGKNPMGDAVKQAGFLVVSLILMAIIYKMKTQVLKYKPLMMGVIFAIFILLCLTVFTRFGVEVNGAKGWLELPGIGRIQPAEFLKVIIVWYLAFILSKRQDTINKNIKASVFRPYCLVASLIFLVLLQKDTGGAVMLILISAAMFFASGVNYSYLPIAGIFGMVISWLTIEGVLFSKGHIFPEKYQYIYKRFAVFRNPFVDPDISGHQMINSYIAMHNGGLFGVGLGNSIQKKGFLPEASTDFIFSIVIEELGLIMASVILIILCFMIARIYLIGIRAKDSFNSLICIGVASVFLVQVFINIGGISGLIPATGVTFPFLSQGGSSLLTLSIGIAFVLNISADEKRSRESEELYTLQIA